MDIIRTLYYIQGAWGDKIYLLFYMCHFAMGLTHCYKTTVFLHLYSVMIDTMSKHSSVTQSTNYSLLVPHTRSWLTQCPNTHLLPSPPTTHYWCLILSRDCQPSVHYKCVYQDYYYHCFQCIDTVDWALAFRNWSMPLKEQLVMWKTANKLTVLVINLSDM